MIYFTLRGGLCNMMFQIAAVTSLALDKKTKPSFGNLEQQLNYLNNENHFNPKLKHSSEYRKLNFFNDMITEKSPKNVKIYSYPFHYEKIEIEGDNAILDGFFQSEKYFKNNEKEIRELFKPTKEITEKIESKYGDILKNNETTSIHVRRGDYVRNQNHHPVLKMGYYNEAIKLTKNKTDKYLVFSDDILACKEMFKGDDFIFIENEKDYLELYLMSMCNNNIIANSSFSWWGAWLNQNENKTVIGPKKWFGINYSNMKSDDIIPNDWVKI